jgi:hypothetical protein
MLGLALGMLPAMHSDTGLWLGAGFLIFCFFIVIPSIAAAIGYAAWKGKPGTFDGRCIGLRLLQQLACLFF